MKKRHGMSEVLSKTLYDEFPAIFAEKDLPMSETAMCWGIQCDDGWFKIIRELCLKLDMISKASGVPIVATTVKEKLGELRFYIRNVGADKTPEQKLWLCIAHDAISSAGWISSHACELCGEMGDLMEKSDKRWLKTLCAKHAKSEGYVEIKDRDESAL